MLKNCQFWISHIGKYIYSGTNFFPNSKLQLLSFLKQANSFSTIRKWKEKNKERKKVSCFNNRGNRAWHRHHLLYTIFPLKMSLQTTHNILHFLTTSLTATHTANTFTIYFSSRNDHFDASDYPVKNKDKTASTTFISRFI